MGLQGEDLQFLQKNFKNLDINILTKQKKLALKL